MGDRLWQWLVIGLFGAVAVEGFVLIGLMREVGALLVSAPGATDSHDDQGPPAMSRVSIPGISFERPTLLVFLSPGCVYCENLLPALPPLAAEYEGRVSIVPVITSGTESERLRYAAEIGLEARTDIPGLAGEWAILGTPFAVAVDADARVRASYVPTGRDSLGILADRLADSSFEVSASSEAPGFSSTGTELIAASASAQGDVNHG